MAENNESFIDLTDGSYTLADHYNLDNVFINLDTDDSILEEVNNQINNATKNGRKRRIKKTRVAVNRESGVSRLEPVTHDLRTPEIKNKRRSIRHSTNASENTTVTEDSADEPKAKKAKHQPICCPICFEQFTGQPLASTSCGHVFCLKCLKLAMKNHSRCPTCRTKLKGSSKFHPIFL